MAFRRAQTLPPSVPDVIEVLSMFRVAPNSKAPALKQRLAARYGRTHFAPHRRYVAPQHEGINVSPYFVPPLS